MIRGSPMAARRPPTSCSPSSSTAAIREKSIRATAVHPGGIQTELSRHIGDEGIKQLIERVNAQTRAAGEPDFKFKTIPQGAATSVWAGAVAAADEVGGRYCEDCHVAEIEPDSAKRAGVKPYALNPETAKALWAKSEEMVGERF